MRSNSHALNYIRLSVIWKVAISRPEREVEWVVWDVDLIVRILQGATAASLDLVRALAAEGGTAVQSGPLLADSDYLLELGWSSRTTERCPGGIGAAHTMPSLNPAAPMSSARLNLPL
jgi:hypothetical protein